MIVEHGDLDRWVLDMGEAVTKAPAETAKVVGRGALQIKKGAQRRISGRRHLPGYPRTISYDVRQSPTVIEAEIGPDKARGGQAPLGAILEYGSVKSPPIPHIAPSVQDELPKFERAMGDLAEKLLEP